MPGSGSTRRKKLLVSKPAPASRTTASAISATMRMPRVRPLASWPAAGDDRRRTWATSGRAAWRPPGGVAGIGGGVWPGGPLGDLGLLAPRLLDGDPGREPADEAQPMSAAVVRLGLPALEDERYPQIGFLRIVPARRSDAD